jgi:ubiquinone/menaquinone biosynthesis C-methylase UbiE
MLNEYDHITATHYAVYRPSLHLKILNEYFEENGIHNFGLDVGCGTGHSSIALTHYCHKVFGIDPSQDMLRKSIPHSKVEYSIYNTNKLDFANDHFDIITFAGSLYYAKSQKLLDEIVRVSKHSAQILVYDFEILLEEILDKLNLVGDSKNKSEYNHEANFSGLNQKNIEVKKVLFNSSSINISISNLSHLILSSKHNYRVLTNNYGDDTIHSKVSEKLVGIFNAEEIPVKAKTYLTTYMVLK